ncbi:MAG TPA: adenylate/guanylate cyclase domain-containing protein [Polyangiaceae bacterium]|nr:adenylate/guanylate cyclase domain-containing protein [Polyangiaceae bacterium]
MSSPANATRDESLARYLSSLELAGLSEATGPSTRALTGALLFIDISGFTALTEQFTSRGPLGAELLSEALNRYFGVMIDVAAEHGGDVHVFAGDALLIVFDAADDARSDAIVRNAARAAFSIRQRLDGSEPVQGTTLKLRLTLGCGNLLAHRIGGVDGRWSTMLCGQALDETFAADAHNTAGEVLVTARAWRFLVDQATGTPFAHGSVRLTSVPAEPEAVPPVSRQRISAHDMVGKQLVSVVTDRLSRGHAAFLAEFRDLTVLFVNLPPDLHEGELRLERLHETLGIVENVVKRLDGTVYTMLHDDKGTAIISVFGLPGQAHEDDAARGAEAATVIREELALRHVAVGIGISTGHVFCGSHGTSRRAHYGIIGRTMNVAARLMQASSGSGILSDEATRRRAQRWYEFEPRGSVELKGFDHAIAVFSPAQRRPGARQQRPTEALIGRAEQLARLRARVQQAAEREGGVLVVEGEAGIGKSALFTTLPGFARELGLRYFTGSTDPLEQNTAYFAFRPIFRELLGVEGQAPDAAAQQVRARLEQLGLAGQLAPLLNLLLPFDIPETPLTAQMSGPIRADNLLTILARLLDATLSETSTLMAIEDLHWMDDASLGLCAELAERHQRRLLLVVNLRPLERPSPALSRLISGPGRERIPLLGLREDDVVELSRRRLAARALPEELKRFIAEKSEGNPFFAEELVFSLRDAHVIEVEGGACRFVDDTAGLDTVSVPSTLNGVIQSRIDRLDPRVQLTLKVASVAGRIFEVEMVTDIHPVREEAVSIDKHVLELNATDIVVPEANAASVQRFRHALVHDTTYGLLAFAQRRALHSAAAEYIERREDLAPYYARLAYHFSQAELPDKAIFYLVRAGRQALAAYANRAAAEFYSQAIELDRKRRGELHVDLERAGWHRQRAEAYYSLMEWKEARRDCEAAVELCGFKRPVAGVGTIGRVLRHVYARHFPSAPAARERADTASGKRSVLALQACDILQVICLWEGDATGLAHTVFQGINIAENAGPSPEAAFARSMIGYLLSVAGLRKAGERDLLAAVAMAESEGQLLQICSTNMYLGMTHSLLGEPSAGIPYLTRADRVATELGAGLWRHRGKFMLGEPHFMRGVYARAAELWQECATISLSVEPPVAGMAHAAKALCLLRRGQTDAALQLVEGPEGIRLVRDNPNGLQLLMCLAAIARGKVNERRYEEALVALDEAVEVASRADVYNFFICHAGLSVLAETAADLLGASKRGAPIGRSSALLESHLEALIAGLGRATRTFPGAVPHHRLAKGRAALERGQVRRARRLLTAAVESATATEQPYERANALWQLGLLSSPEQRASLQASAESIFIELGVAYDRLTQSAAVDHG